MSTAKGPFITPVPNSAISKDVLRKCFVAPDSSNWSSIFFSIFLAAIIAGLNVAVAGVVPAPSFKSSTPDSFSSKGPSSKLDVKPLWTFIGLEDARFINWNNKFYACGVRRDTTTNGQGRMEMSELEISDNFVKEIKRNRIEPPIDKNSYCEKNWMPVKNKPNHFIKWSNPTEVVEIDISNNISKQVFVGNTHYLNKDLRGGSQLIKWENDCYLAIVHSCDFISKNFNGYKDAEYHHYFVIWNSDWSIQYISNPFNFMTSRIEFCIGLEQIDNDIIIAFSFQDNGSYLVKLSKNILDDILWYKLKSLICNIEKE